MRDSGRPALYESLGDHEAVEIDTSEGLLKCQAIVGSLRVEEVSLLLGNVEETSYRDVCQVSINVAARLVSLKTRIKVIRYTSGDIDTHDRQLFYMRSIERLSDGWVTAQVWRESLAKVQRRGTEGAT